MGRKLNSPFFINILRLIFLVKVKRMALWGTSDSLYSVGTVEVNYNSKKVIGSGTSFTASGISTGDVITIGAGGTFGSAVISGITSDRLISIATTQYLTGRPISGVAYSLSERPVYTLEDSNYSSNVVGLTTTIPTHNVYGIDQYEIALTAPGASGIATQYGGIHAGWVGVQTYMGAEGYMRVKMETLVAMSEISSGTASYSSVGDAGDDAILADAIITILTQPEDAVGIGTTDDAVFVVEASVVPSYAPLSYQWTADGVSLSDVGDYSGVITPILVVQNDSDKAGIGYSVIISSGDVSVVSTAATISYS
jgi:hypothetical protein